MPVDAASAPECRRKFSGLYKVLHPKSQRPLARAFRGLMALVILVDVGTCFLATVPSMHAAPAWRSLDACDRVTTAIFLAEYLLRLLVVTESTTYAHPIRGRLKYMLSWGALIDALSTVPFALQLFLPHVPRLRDYFVGQLTELVVAMRPELGAWVTEVVAPVLYFPDVAVELVAALMDEQGSQPGALQACRAVLQRTGLLVGGRSPRASALRVLRLTRLLRTERVASAIAIAHRILWFNREILCAALVLCTVLITMTAALLYLLPPVNSADFESLPATTYLAVLMLTGQGLGLEITLPWYTKGLVVMTGIFSVALFGIPASMITWGFEAEAARMARRRAWLLRTRRRRPSSQSLGAATKTPPPQDPKDEVGGFGECLSEEEEGAWLHPVFDYDDHTAWHEYEAAIVGHEPSTPAGRFRSGLGMLGGAASPRWGGYVEEGREGTWGAGMSPRKGQTVTWPAGVGGSSSNRTCGQSAEFQKFQSAEDGSAGGEGSGGRHAEMGEAKAAGEKAGNDGDAAVVAVLERVVSGYLCTHAHAHARARARAHTHTHTRTCTHTYARSLTQVKALNAHRREFEGLRAEVCSDRVSCVICVVCWRVACVHGCCSASARSSVRMHADADQSTALEHACMRACTHTQVGNLHSEQAEIKAMLARMTEKSPT